MSNDVVSGIFDSLINVFKEYLPQEMELYVSKYPIDGCNIYHYHRPNLEKELLENSVVTIHHDLEDTDHWFDSSNFIDRYHEANHIICLNKLQQEILQSENNISNTVVIPHGVFKNNFNYQKRTFKKKQKFRIGIVSKRYGRRVKGEAFLLEIYKRIDPEIIEFIYVGEGRSIDKAKSSEFGFSSECYETLPYKMFGEIYKDLNLLLVPSLFEGGPANIPEAIYSGLPILGREIAMIKDYVINGENGYFLTGNYNKDSILINKLAKNEDNIYLDLLNKISSSKRECLSWEDVVNEHVNLYKLIISNQQDEEVIY
tara:strand:+ start:165 stop:1106 length:942 start_codon:yes stop_codon:yes gene_type:complete